jgi:hypothetical protein
MNILGTCRHLLQYLSLSPAAESSEPKAEKEVDDSDGPGAGGGYEDSVELEESSDGPGAGGGYDDSVDTDESSDGPGAGGGYDDSVDTDESSDGPGAGGGYDGLGDDDGPGAGGGYDTLNDSDGPGAGGGYHTLNDFDLVPDGAYYDEHPVTGQATSQNPWTSSANYLGQEWFLESTPVAANSNKDPDEKTVEGESK